MSTATVPTIIRLNAMHVSMHVYDNDRQKSEDAAKIFTYAQKKKKHWVGGTELGQPEDKQRMAAQAEEHDFRFTSHRGNDCWFAVAKSFIKGDWDPWFEPVLTHDEGVGPHGNKGVQGVGFETEYNLGHLDLAAGHYLTHGKPSGPAEIRQNLELNRRYARTIGEQARARGRGYRNLFHYQGDQNIIDKRDDTFLGEPLTSSWDLLSRWRNTGHGNIDVAGMFDADLKRRVQAAYCRTLTDREFFLHTDHFVVEFGWDVLALPPVPPEPVLHACPECGVEHLGVIAA